MLIVIADWFDATATVVAAPRLIKERAPCVDLRGDGNLALAAGTWPTDVS